jgi:AcrR family transcriptional regulator
MRLAAEDRRKQLIEAAMKLFSERGFEGASTREIAEEAGINEALIFRHFSSKEELFWAVIADKLEAIGRWRQFKDQLTSTDEPRQVLIRAAKNLLERTADDRALTRLLFFSALRTGELSDRFFRTYMAGTFELLGAYIRKGVESGDFREVDSVVAARAFLGMVVYHYLVQEIMGGAKYKKFDAGELAEEMVGVFLDGISRNSAVTPAPEDRTFTHAK